MTGERLKSAVAAVVVAAVAKVVVGGIRGAALRIQTERRIANHARFEGTRAPHEARMARARRRLDRMEGAVSNHALHEGAPVH